MQERIKQKPKMNLLDIKQILDQNSTIKKVAYFVMVIGAIYVAGKLSNGMASAVRGFKNLGSAIKGV